MKSYDTIVIGGLTGCAAAQIILLADAGWRLGDLILFG